MTDIGKPEENPEVEIIPTTVPIPEREPVPDRELVPVGPEE